MPEFGSLPGGDTVRDILFVEEPTAGTYTATLPIEAGAQVMDVLMLTLQAWAADTVHLTAGDSADAAGYYNALDVLAQGVAGHAVSSGITVASGSGGTYEASMSIYSHAGDGPYYDGRADTLTVTLVTTIAAPPVVATGRMLIRVLYRPPTSVAVASFS